MKTLRLLGATALSAIALLTMPAAQAARAAQGAQGAQGSPGTLSDPAVQSAQAKPAGHADPVRKGALFTQSRAQLLKQGWRPVKVHAGEDYDYTGTESALIKAKILEVESCAMDRALCIFHYQKAKRCLRVVTSGEEVATMTIESSDPTCPKPRRPDGQ